MTQPVRVAGVGMTRFYKPKESPPYHALGAEAVRRALADAGIGIEQVQQAYASYVYGDSCCGQAALYAVGMTGLPIVNVNNNCSSGSTALYLARQAVASGAADCVLAFGFEQMAPGAIGSSHPEGKPDPMQRFFDVTGAYWGPEHTVPPAPAMFAGAAREYLEAYGARPETMGKIVVKARRHAAKNENAVFREPLSLEEVMASPSVCDPITRFQCCPPTCGGAAAILCSEAFARRHGIAGDVLILGQALTSDRPDSFDGSMMKLVGYDMARAAAQTLYAQTGIGPDAVDLVELHDCFAPAEVLAYEAIGLVPEGGAEAFVWDGQNSYGGRVVVNASGGLLAKGHPSGATGLAQCAEINWHLRGMAGARQVEGARIGLQHNLGLGGACVLTMYGRG